MVKVVSVLYYLYVTVYSLVYYVFFFIVFLLCLPFDRERVVIHALSAFWARSVFTINPLWKVVLEGKEHIEPGKPYVITVNHQAMLDVPMLYVLPLRLKWVSKREVYKIPLFGWVLWMHDDITISRGDQHSAAEMLRQGTLHLSRGTSIIIFPEGTRSRDGEIHRYKEGAFLLAKSAGVGILPVVQDGTRRAMDGWKFRRNRFTVRILPPVSASDVAAAEPRAMAQRVQDQTAAALEEIRKEA